MRLCASLLLGAAGAAARFGGRSLACEPSARPEAVAALTALFRNAPPEGDPCQWPGVECTSDGWIRRLEAPGDVRVAGDLRALAGLAELEALALPKTQVR